MMSKFKLFLISLAVFFLLLLAGYLKLKAGCKPQPPQVSALWVTRFNYTTADDVQRIIDNVGQAGFTDVFFQIRGNATAFYQSQLEPWAFELTSRTVATLGVDPGWDPLQLAIDQARPYGLRVHAYINVLPAWKGLEEPPIGTKQLWREHPDWFMVDSSGEKMLPTSGWYSFINPLVPEVRAHLRGIVAELCQYDIAGIHLDYIRYPHDYHLVAGQRYPKASQAELLRHSDFSYDPTSQAALLDQYGEQATRQQVTAFRCESITRIVRDLSLVMRLHKPSDCRLSASVMGNPVEGKYCAYQDSGTWAREGLVDWVVQMNYGDRSFDRYLKAMRKATGRCPFSTSVVVGINCENDIEELVQQLDTVRESGCRGVALFSYKFLFDKQHEPTEKGRILLPIR